MVSRLISWAIFFAAVGTFVYFFQTQVKVGVMEIYRLALPCTIATTYKIGSVDPRFGISSSTLRVDLQNASELWNDAAGKKLFAYDPDGTLTVNLVYDSRQEMTQRLRQLGITLSNDRASYEIVKSNYDSMYATYEAKKRDFEADLAAFESRRDKYQSQVDYWNSRGGAPKQEFQQLQAEQRSLASGSEELKRKQDSLNQTARDVNDLARSLNLLIQSLKLDVEKYNTTGAENGDTFEQGIYERQLGVETITIFEYENNALLTRVLAHELGHAIGLDHVEDADAVMYYLNQGEKIALTKSDKVELARACRL